MNLQIREAIGRIYTMEAVFDALLKPAFRNDPRYDRYLKRLLAYYESPLWLSDYGLDEQGLLPAGLKRGVLSEDGVYNFLAGLCRDEE